MMKGQQVFQQLQRVLLHRCPWSWVAWIISMERRQKQECVMSNADHKPSIADLPGHILATIFSRLPVKTILACTFVCRSFFHVTTQYKDMLTLHSNAQTELLVQFFDDCSPSQTVSLIQTEQDLFRGFGVVADIRPRFNIPRDNTGYTMVNSCNGFICLKAKSTNDPRVVCNPITGEYVILPGVQTGTTEETIGCGLGFCSNARAFKVLRVFRVLEVGGRSKLLAQIHSVGSSSWRSIGVAPFSPYRNLVFLHGALHWIDYQSGEKIVSFNFESESFTEIQPPSEFEMSHSRLTYNTTVGVLQNFLVVCYAFRKGRYEIWQMTEYGNQQSWSKCLAFDISASRSFCSSLRGLQWPLTCLENREIVMVSDDNLVFCYDLENEISRVFKFRGIHDCFRAISHTPSFHLLADRVEVLNLRPRLAREEGGVCASNLVEYYRASATHEQELPKHFF